MGGPMFVEMVVLPILGMGVGAGFLWGVYRTVNRALERRHERIMATAGGMAPEQLEEMTRRLEAVDDLAYRMQDLEERMDFAERVLARQREPGRLPAGE